MSKATTAATKEQLVELMQYLSQNISVPTIGIGGGFAPIGTIISYMGTTAPQDYLICDGTTYNIADYKQLSDFFAAQFGSANFFGGDGVTTFAVPDLRGEFLRGTGTNGHSGEGNGANVGTHQSGSVVFNAYSGSNIISLSESVGYYEDKMITEKGRNIATKTSSDSNASVYKVRPTNTSVLYCIKAVVAGDVYSTTERVVGTWIDGKPVYEKVFSDTMPSSVNTDKSTSIGASVDKIVFISSIVYNDSNGGFIPLNLYNEAENYGRVYAKNNLSEDPNIIGYNTNISSWLEKPVYTILRYTKTTD